MIDGWITQLRKGVLEFCVLTVLSRGRAMAMRLCRP
jgi:hypothetical protein